MTRAYVLVMAVQAWMTAGTPSVTTVFHVSTSVATWNEAALSCESSGARLTRLDAPVKIDAMNHVLTNGFSEGGKTLYWTGLHRTSQQDEVYAWENCDILGRFSHWDNKSMETASNFCVAGNSADKQLWSVESCGTKLNYVCEETAGNPCTFENVLNKVVDATKYDGRRREAETEQHCQQQCLQFEEEYKECWVYTYRLETCILYVDNIFGSIQDASDWKNQNNSNLGRKVCFSTNVMGTHHQVTSTLAKDIPNSSCWNEQTTTRFTTTDPKNSRLTNLATSNHQRTTHSTQIPNVNESRPSSLTEKFKKHTTTIVGDEHSPALSTVPQANRERTSNLTTTTYYHETTAAFTGTPYYNGTTTSAVRLKYHHTTTTSTVAPHYHGTFSTPTVTPYLHATLTTSTMIPHYHETARISSVTPDYHEILSTPSVTPYLHATSTTFTVTPHYHETRAIATLTSDVFSTKSSSIILDKTVTALNSLDENTTSSGGDLASTRHSLLANSASWLSDNSTERVRPSTPFDSVSFTSVTISSHGEAPTEGSEVVSTDREPAQTETPVNETSCSCYCGLGLPFKDGPEELEQMIDIPIQRLSATRRRLNCAEDNRTSSVTCGVVAALIMALIWGGFVLSDLINVLQRMYQEKPATG